MTSHYKTLTRHRLLFLAVVTLLFSGSLSAATPLEIDSLLKWTYVTDPRWSPDGKSLAYLEVVTDVEADRYRSQLMLHTGASGGRRLSAEGRAARMPRWSHEGSWLGYVEDSDGASALRLLPMKGGESRQVTLPAGQIIDYQWSPVTNDLVVLFRPASDDDDAGYYTTDRLDGRRDGRRGYRPSERSRLLRVRAATGEAPSIDWLSDDLKDAAPAQWASDGQSIFYTSHFDVPVDRNREQTDIVQLFLDEPDKVVRWTDRVGPDEWPTPSPDGRWLALIGEDTSSPPVSYQTSELTLIDLKGERETVNLTSDFDYAVGDGMAGDVNAPASAGARLRWSADSKSLYFTSAMEGRVQLMQVSIESGQVEPVTRIDEGEIGVFDVSATGQVAAVFSRPDLPPNLVGFQIGRGSRGAWRELTSSNKALLKDHRLAPYTELRAKRDDGSEIQGWLIAPPRLDRRRSYPMILYVHGGPHSMYGSNFFHEFQVLANAGYYVLISNPRGSTGYGSAFGNSIQYEYPGEDFNDLMAIVDLAVAEKTIDADRLGVAGGSGGGLLTTWIVAKTDRFKAASAQRSVTNWLSFVGTSDYNYYFATHWFEDFPWRQPEKYLARSPLSYVDDVKTPIQIIHSDADFRTPLEQSLQYYTALRMLDKPAELLVFKDESHGLSRGGRPSNRVARLQAIVDWFDRYLR